MGQQKASRGTTLFAVSAAHFMLPFMLSAVGVALPTLGRDLGASAKQLGLVETSYILSLSVLLLAVGRLGDIHGRRRLFQTGIAVFTVVGGALSQARSVEIVIALRLLQGVGGAMIAATGMAIVVGVFPPNERGKALGISVATVYAGISCGPFIGGALVSAFGWRSLFYLCVPMGLATFLLVRWKLRGEWADARGEPFDWQGSLVYAAAIVLLLLGCSNLDRGRWAWGALGAGTAGVGLFVWVEARTTYPVLDVRLLRDNRLFALSNLAALLNYAATFGVTFFLSLYLQYVKGLPPRTAGLVLMVQPAVMALLSPLCGRLSDRYAAARVATAGMALCALGLGVAATLTGSTPLSVVLVMLTLLGIGFALFSSPNNSLIMGSVPPRHLGVASGLAASMRTLGMMTSMTIITLAFSVFMGGHSVTPQTQPAFLSSMRVSLLTFCLLCVGGILCSLGRWRLPLPVRPAPGHTRT